MFLGRVVEGAFTYDDVEALSHRANSVTIGYNRVVLCCVVLRCDAMYRKTNKQTNEHTSMREGFTKHTSACKRCCLLFGVRTSLGLRALSKTQYNPPQQHPVKITQAGSQAPSRIIATTTPSTSSTASTANRPQPRTTDPTPA